VYGFLAGTWPFGAVEVIWSAIAARRYVHLRREERGESAAEPAEDREVSV
jgi:hypothetical protein